MKKGYAEKYKDPRWQKRRLEILARDEFTCQDCGTSTASLHVHHRFYRWGVDPWEHPDDALVTLCEGCHGTQTEARSSAQRALVESVLKHLLAEDVARLAEAIDAAFSMANASASDVANALCAVLHNREAVDDLVSRISYIEANALEDTMATPWSQCA